MIKAVRYFDGEQLVNLVVGENRVKEISLINDNQLLLEMVSGNEKIIISPFIEVLKEKVKSDDMLDFMEELYSNEH